jgi:metal-responsive CopG/Arc/MetJ family transcriptional regulator
MKVRTYLTLSKSLIEEIDELNDHAKNRAMFIEEAINAYVALKRRIIRDKRDLELINRSARELKQEAEDVLSYQVDI